MYGAIEDETAAARELEGMVALGEERTIQQDPAFAIRIMVDIAIRALSPAVNDPTTAVQVLNHLGELLRLIGATELRRPTERANAAGRPALFVPMRAWEDFLTLGVTEIREYGATSSRSRVDFARCSRSCTMPCPRRTVRRSNASSRDWMRQSRRVGRARSTAISP